MPRGPQLRRRQNVWRQLDAASRYVFPAGVLIFGLFLMGIPLDLPFQAELRPVFAMACVFFWSLYRPSSLPAPVVVGTGLLLDLLGLSPLGLWAVLLLVLQGVVLALRRRLIARGFLLIWLIFVAFAASVSCLAWMVQSLLTLALLPAAPVGAESFLAICLYPVLAAFFIRAHRGPAAVELA